MKAICIFGHQFEVIREEWLPPKDEMDTVSHLQFLRCQCCKETRATITHPHDYKSSFSHPRWVHKWTNPEDFSEAT